jgi:hypothetical protein
MIRPGDTCSSISRLIRQYRRAAFISGLACGLVFAMTPLAAQEPEASAVPDASAAPEVATAAAGAPETSGASAAPATLTLAKPADAGAEKSTEQQRRVLMLLLMNSVGPVRPFGNLGR